MKRNTKIVLSTFVTILIIVGLAFVFFDMPFLRKEEKVLETKKSSPGDFTYNVSRADGAKITEIVQTVAHTSTVALAFKSGHLHNLGHSVDKTVASFEFLAYIFSHPELADDMALIQKSSMKYNNFVEGLYKGLVGDYNRGIFYARARGFAHFLGLDEEKTISILKGCIEDAIQNKNKRAFKPFLNYLIAMKAHKGTSSEYSEQENTEHHQETTPSTPSKTPKEPFPSNGKKKGSKGSCGDYQECPIDL